MSVYTPLSLKDVQAFALPYGLEVVDLIPIQGGIENTNYFLVTQDQKQYVLTVFELLDERGANELPPILEYLGAQGVPVAVPLSCNHQYIHTISNKPAQIAPRLQGEHPIPSHTAQVSAIAQAQAQLHKALLNYSIQRQSSRNHVYWTSVGGTLKASMDEQDLMLLNHVYSLFNSFKKRYPDLPQGWIHSDLFRDNTLFEGNKLTGILDFSEMNKDDLLFDLAISINDFCTDYPTAVLNAERKQAFIDEYQKERSLTEDERACLPIYLAMAACRFWLMRLQVAQRNQQEGLLSEDIMQKDPLEMRAMLVDRLSLVERELGR